MLESEEIDGVSRCQPGANIGIAWFSLLSTEYTGVTPIHDCIIGNH